MAHQSYWAIAVPESNNTFKTVEQKLSGSASVFKFNIPDFRVGTLDTLLSLSDDLVKHDAYAEAITKKIAHQLFNLFDNSDKQVKLEVNQALPHDYVQRFTWAEAKYPLRASLKEITDMLVTHLSKLDEELRSKVSDYSQISHGVASNDRNQSGNLTNKDLSDIVREDQCLETEYITTLFVAVPKVLSKDWESSYWKLSEYVIPQSLQTIAEETDFLLSAVYIMRKGVDEFKNAARDSKYIVREFKYDPAAIAQTKEERRRLNDEKTNKKAKLVAWCNTNFGEAFMSWIHLKAVRLFVESVLRFGLPVNVRAMLILPHRPDDKRVRKSLFDVFKHLGNKYSTSVEEEEGEAFYPYVNVNLMIDMTS